MFMQNKKWKKCSSKPQLGGKMSKRRKNVNVCKVAANQGIKSKMPKMEEKPQIPHSESESSYHLHLNHSLTDRD